MTPGSAKGLFAVVLALALHLAPVGPAATQERGDARAHLVAGLFAALDRSESPGAAVAVVRNGEVLLTEGYGLASLEHRVPITSTTVFDLASLSKQFTGLAIAMLVEDGRIRLDDDIRHYIPEVPDFGHTITIGHLVHHTSGLRDWPGTLALGGMRFDDVISFDQILRMVYNQQDLNFEPGSEYVYSNTGYNLMAELVSRVTGRTFRDWMDEHVFRPLGMTRTHFHDDHTEVVPNRAFGYSLMRDGSHRYTPNNLTAIGSSSLFSTVDDLARWLINLDRPVVGGRSTMALVHTRGRLNDGTMIEYAFGLSHGVYRGLPTVAHSGGWASFQTYLVHFPEQGFGAVVLANGTAVNPARTAYAIADIYLADELDPWEMPGPGAVESLANSTSIALDDYEGLYRLGSARYLRVRHENAGLLVQATNESEFPVMPRSETEFWVEAYGASIGFERDTEGRVPHLEYRGVRAPRVEDQPPPRLAELTGEYVSDELETSYAVVLENDRLAMRHRRHGTIPLIQVRGDEFAGSAGFLASVEFRRDDGGRVVGLLVNAGERSRDIRFLKRTQ
jgi:CubicO group peptidase (beta-lactamase class C family)